MNVVIVGTGPAGSAVAIGALKENPDIKIGMYDRRRITGQPVQCAGGIVKYWLDQAGMEIPDEVIATRLRGAELHGPDGTKAVLEAPGDEVLGYVTHRAKFDRWMVQQAIDLGVTGVYRDDPSSWEKPYSFNCDFLIGADGWRSQLGRHHGFRVDLGADRHLGMEYRIQLEQPCNPGHIHLYFGTELAPRGYVWVFPESPETVKIGIGTTPNHRPRKYLDRFIAEVAPGEGWSGEVLGVSAGGIIPTARPVSHPWRVTGGKVVALVGDAARQTDPLHGGGIANGILAGLELGRQIGKKGHLNKYVPWLRDNLHKELERRYVMKRVFSQWNDRGLQDMVDVMKKIQVTDEPINVQVRRFVLSLLRNKPSLFPRLLVQLIRTQFKSG